MQETIDGMIIVEVNGRLNYTKDRRGEEKLDGYRENGPWKYTSMIEKIGMQAWNGRIKARGRLEAGSGLSSWKLAQKARGERMERPGEWGWGGGGRWKRNVMRRELELI